MAEQEQKHKEEPIIIKKKKGHGGHGHHGGAWKVAYADFVTAMMAFFIVMWILASSQEVKQSISSYFNDPGAFNFVTGERTIPIDLGLQPKQGKGGEGGDKDGQKLVISFSEELRDSVVQQLREKAKIDSTKAAEQVKKTGEELQNRLNNLLNKRPDLHDILTSIKIEITNEGLRIELIESSESVFFKIGSATLKSEAIELLQGLAREVGKLPNNVEIEGHTDGRAYSGKNDYTNWELSADRANSARRILEKTGFWEGQVTKVTGYGDRKLRNPSNPFDFSNRRISILIKQLSAKDFLPNTQNGEQQ
jgi:chemotaxis protein MotB